MLTIMLEAASILGLSQNVAEVKKKSELEPWWKVKKSAPHELSTVSDLLFSLYSFLCCRAHKRPFVIELELDYSSLRLFGHQ